MSADNATVRPARSTEGREPETGRRLERLRRFAFAVVGIGEDPRVKRLGLGAAGRLGELARVAIVVLDPFEERLARCGGDRRVVAAGHDQPLVPTARRYSVTWAVPDTPASTASAVRIAG